MEIYLVPARRHRYELYCEAEDSPVPHDPDARSSWRQRLARRFHEGMAALEAYRRQRLSRAAAAGPGRRSRRVRDRVLAWLAERVAEQRLLWFLRSETTVTARYPDDVPARDAERFVRDELKRDGRRHLFWMVVDTLVYLASLPLTPIPGPNVLSLYFSFRAIGHLLSWMGARHGLRRVRWAFVASAPLADLRRVPALARADALALARDVASRLALRHLDVFVERVGLAGP